MYPEFGRHRLPNLSWSIIREIIRIDNKNERDYYLKESSSQNWSYRELKRNIQTNYYNRLLSSNNKSELITYEEVENNNNDKSNIEEFIKDPYILEFLNLQIFHIKWK